MNTMNKTAFRNGNLAVGALYAVLAFWISGPAMALAAGPATVDMLSLSNFAIVSGTGITNTGSHTTSITGNIGSSPITAAAMDNVFCSELTGTMYGVDAAYTGSGTQTCFAGNPPLSNKTLIDNAVLDVATAYNDAAGRTLPNGSELFAGNIGGQTFAPGLYKWSTDVSIPTDVTLSGGANDVWIFQVAGNLSVASGGSVPAGVKVVLSGGAQASNVFWQVGGGTGATLGTYSTFNGTILSAKQVIIQTGAVLNGRALSQTQVTLDANTVSVPVAAAPAATQSSQAAASSGGSSSGNDRNTASGAARILALNPTPVSTTVSVTVVSAPTPAPAPDFPNTGFPPVEGGFPMGAVILALGLGISAALILPKKLMPGSKAK